MKKVFILDDDEQEIMLGSLHETKKQTVDDEQRVDKIDRLIRKIGYAPTNKERSHETR